MGWKPRHQQIAINPVRGYDPTYQNFGKWRYNKGKPPFLTRAGEERIPDDLWDRTYNSADSMFQRAFLEHKKKEKDFDVNAARRENRWDGSTRKEAIKMLIEQGVLQKDALEWDCEF